MANIAALKRTRAGTKSRLTRFRQFIDGFTNETGDLVELQTRLERADNLLTEFNEGQDKLRVLDEDEHLGDDLNAENDLFENLFYEAISRAKRLVGSATSSNDSQNQSARGPRANLLQPNSQFVHHNVKIPTIALPQFDGSYEKWTQFYDLFTALVDSDESLSNVQKLYYLQSVLKDQAAQIIQSLPITGDNYQVALDLLKQRFENKRLTTRYHVRALFELPQVQRESASGLRALSDELCKHLRALQNLGEPVDSWDTLLIEIVMNKLDSLTKREWEQRVISKQWSTVDNLKEFLSNRCQILEAIQQKRGKEEISLKSQPASHLKQKAGHSTSHVSTARQFSCNFCHEDHRIYQCKQFLDLPVQTRINEIKRINLCLNCLGKGHTTKVCKSRNCQHCDKKHNSLLHLADQSDYLKRHQSALGTKPTKNSDNANEPTQSTSTKETNSIATCAFKPTSQVLLSTAMVYVQDSSGRKIEARALLDSGSQTNFMTRDLSDQLKLPLRKIRQSVGAIAQTVTHVSTATNATIQSKYNGYSVELSFSILEKITD